MEAVLIQMDRATAIKNLASNIKKIAIKLRTKENLSSNLERLNTAWLEFEKCDDELQVSQDHGYITNNIFEKTKEKYLSSKEWLEEKINEEDDCDSDSLNNDDKVHNGQKVAQLTRLINTKIEIMDRTLEKMRADFEEEQSVHFYKVKRQRLEAMWSEIEKISTEIIFEDKFGSFDARSLEDIEDQYQEILIKYEEKMSERIDQPIVSSLQQQTNLQINLPKITLPNFNGSYAAWEPFKNLFLEVIDKSVMTGIQKMAYLKANLIGEALGVIQHLQISENNYCSAWQLLCSRYDNKRLQVTSILDKLLQQPTITQESPTAIKGLHDTTMECMHSLVNLKLDIKGWDPILHYLLIKKLDVKTHTAYEQSLAAPRELQGVSELLEYLENRFQALELTYRKPQPQQQQQGQINKHQEIKKVVQKSVSSLTTMDNSAVQRCQYCNDNHLINNCLKFLDLSVVDRISAARSKRLCLLCLKPGHRAFQCRGMYCEKCKKRHNVKLHLDVASEKPVANTVELSEVKSENDGLVAETVTNLAATAPVKSDSYVFLATAIIKLGVTGKIPVECRALLDSGSQLSFVTERLQRKLGVSSSKHNLQLAGIGQYQVDMKGRVNLELSSGSHGFKTTMEFFIIPKIIGQMPTRNISVEGWPLPKNITLADPNFNKAAQIDVLLGADIFSSILSIGQIKLGRELPALQNTIFGWVITGRAGRSVADDVFCGMVNNIDLDSQLRKFWELEEFKGKPEFTVSESSIEENFERSVRRDETGRFVVRLPFIKNKEDLGETRNIAERRFFAIERRLIRNQEIHRQYTQFLNEYLELGHMEKIEHVDMTKPHSFLPHHFVLRPDSQTTKLRVVFDASVKSSSNISLNDLMATGPTIQDNLFNILIRFRTKKYAFTADIEKMYRQILVDPEDQKMQLILWRSDPKEKMGIYQLKTVTYGTRAAPYLATKSLQTLADCEGENYPLAKSVVKNDFYVDDLISGCNDLTRAMETRDQLIAMMKSGGMNLRKWCSNHRWLLEDLPESDQGQDLDWNFSGENIEGAVKTLGVFWMTRTDNFQYKVILTESKRITKRSVLSEISRLFDPLGLVNPVVVWAKGFMQELWELKLDWDASLPQEMHTRWINFRERLNQINNITVPRFVSSDNILHRQLHGFCDASQLAYGAAIYLRTMDDSGNIVCHLLCAKSRVAPVKTVSIPRLELCAAKLLTSLVATVCDALNMNANSVTYWSDAKIVLSWIRAKSSSFKIFVANRVAAIQRNSNKNNWRYVPTKENPADLVSRGIFTDETREFWFQGPKFLKLNQNEWPADELQLETENFCEERRTKMFGLLVHEQDHFLDQIEHHNSFWRLQRITAWMIRFLSGKVSKPTPWLTLDEMNESRKAIIRRMQQVYYADEISSLVNKSSVKRQSRLVGLDPFLDADGLVRVGGRLENSILEYDGKHPIIIPHEHPWTRLMLEDYHKDYLHAGAKSLLSIVRQRFWITNSGSVIRTIISNCQLCRRASGKCMAQKMGQLPKDRVRPSRPFGIVGIDYLGPITIYYNIRGKRPTKSYMCVFVCFVTKAIHLEVVSDLTTAAFLNCLRRFIGRRGCPVKIYCDNATNFVGARNEMARLAELVLSKEHQMKVQEQSNKKGIQWRFIPARTPHYGGLWEAAVKSTKKHLTIMLHNARFTFEELATLGTEIEAILNSRPLTSISNSPDDLETLTPGHFLIGQPMTALPTGEMKTGLLNENWKDIQKLKNTFWLKWSQEYLCELMKMTKWRNSKANIKEGALVVLKDDNLKPLEWRMARVTKVILGNDNHARSVELKTSTGQTTRGIHKLCVLPSSDDWADIDTVAITDCANSFMVANIHNKRSIHWADSDDECGYKGSRKKQRQSMELQSQNLDWPEQYPVAATLIQNLLKRSGVEQNPGPANIYVTWIWKLLVLILCIGKISSDEFVISKLNPSSGIYFENIGDGGITSNNWKLIIYYDMQNYWTEYEGFRILLNKLNKLCDASGNNSYCNAVLNQFRVNLVNIQNNNKIMFQAPSVKTGRVSRSRRGLFNFVGSIHNFLWGTLDQSYADEIANIIDKVKDNEDHLLSLIRNQTSIIESTRNLMVKTDQDIKEQFDSIGNELTKLAKANYVVKTEGQFATLAIHTSLMMSSFSQIQGAILTVLLDLHNGKISPLLLTPDQLKNEVTMLRAHLPSSLKLPTEKQNSELLSLYEIMTINGHVEKDKLIFVVQVPLLLNEPFVVYKVVPVPMFINREFSVIATSTDYLMANLHFDKFYLMRAVEFNECQRLQGRKMICKQMHPIYSRLASKDNCEVSLLIGHQEATSMNCQIVTARDGWVQLQNPNHWLFSVQKGIGINIVCNGKLHQVSIESSGIIKLTDNCLIRHDTMIINSHANFEATIRDAIIPIIGPDVFENVTIKDIQGFHIKYALHNKTINDINMQIQQLKNQQKLPNNILQNGHNVHHYALGYTLAIVIVLMLIFLWYQRRNNGTTKIQTNNAFELKLQEYVARENEEPAV